MTFGPLLEIVSSIPPVTRTIMIMAVFLCIITYTDLVAPYHLTLTGLSIQVHRMVTSLLYFGPPDLATFIDLYFLLRYSKMLEDGFLSTSDYVYFIGVIAAMIEVVGLVLKIGMLGPLFSTVITYVWTRKNPHVQIQMLGCFVFPAFYLPLVLFILAMLSGRRLLKNEVLGIFIGHVYYFLKFELPRSGYDPIRTPNILYKIFREGRRIRNSRRGVQTVRSNASEDQNGANTNVNAVEYTGSNSDGASSMDVGNARSSLNVENSEDNSVGRSDEDTGTGAKNSRRRNIIINEESDPGEDVESCDGNDKPTH